MFYITNQSCLRGSIQPNTQINDLYNLQKCTENNHSGLSIALRRNILAFKTTKIRDEIEPVNSDKELSTPGTSSLEDKGEKKDEKTESPVEVKIKNGKETKENSNPIAFENVLNYQKSDKNGMSCEKRRITRNPKEEELGKIDKSCEKKIKTINDIKTDFPTLIATVPHLIKLSNRHIQLMKEELKKRTVEEWHLVDPEDLRRRRFIKQMF